MVIVSLHAHYKCILDFMFCFLFDEIFLRTTFIGFDWLPACVAVLFLRGCPSKIVADKGDTKLVPVKLAQ
jgi:hypothetical protein